MHVFHITQVEELLSLKCPNQRCRRAFVDFNGCTALSCNACNTHFCAWCLRGCESSQACHAHVLTCPQNANPNDYFTSVDVYNAHALQRSRRLVEGYVRDSVPPELHERMRRATQPELRPVVEGREPARRYAGVG